MENINKINLKGIDYQIQDSVLTDKVTIIEDTLTKFKGIYKLSANNFYDLTEESCRKDIVTNTENVFLTFSFNNSAPSGKENGYILNIINGINGTSNTIKQYLFWKQGLKPEMIRTLKLSESGNIIAVFDDGSEDTAKNFQPYYDTKYIYIY